jgi:hypothetical protein
MHEKEILTITRIHRELTRLGIPFHGVSIERDMSINVSFKDEATEQQREQARQTILNTGLRHPKTKEQIEASINSLDPITKQNLLNTFLLSILVDKIADYPTFAEDLGFNVIGDTSEPTETGTGTGTGTKDAVTISVSF